MNTRYLQFNESDLQLAGRLIREGNLVAFPTETVYGLGANALDENAVKSTYLAKGRPSDNPLIVHVWNKSQIFDIAARVTADAEKIIDNLMPASITIVLPKKSVVPDCVTADLDTVAIRMPKSPQARQFLRYCDVPVTAPSANTSSRPSPTTWQAVKEDMDGKISAILCGEPCEVGIESTVVDLCGDTPLVLRPGIITPEILQEVLQKTVRVVTNPKEKVNSPGVRYKHYAPKAQITILDADSAQFVAYVNAHKRPGLFALCFAEDVAGLQVPYVSLGADEADQARHLFAALRQLDELGAKEVYARCPDKEGVGLAVYNRLIRAAAYHELPVEQE